VGSMTEVNSFQGTRQSICLPSPEWEQIQIPKRCFLVI
jgi:hypothetical protein